MSDGGKGADWGKVVLTGMAILFAVYLIDSLKQFFGIEGGRAFAPVGAASQGYGPGNGGMPRQGPNPGMTQRGDHWTNRGPSNLCNGRPFGQPFILPDGRQAVCR
jgi:hypothetical protein